MSRQLAFDWVDPETIDLSHMRCDLRGLSAEEAAKKFYGFLCEVAKIINAGPPFLSPPGAREESRGFWWVAWEDCPWPEWAITGGGWIDGPLAGWESLRNGVHNRNPELGPFFHQDYEGLKWHLETYYGFDAIFWGD